MEKNRICKICNRRFANGKAMGGHMRSHLAKLPLPPKPTFLSPENPVKSPSLSSSSSLNYPLTPQNPIQSYRSVNHELTYLPKPEDGDGETESDNESPRSTTRRRSKRRRKIVVKAEESPEQVSSISEIFNEEDVALCLLMLSRDNKKTKSSVEIEADDDDEDESFGEVPIRSKSKRFKCETCKKGFQSYQALGGHKASHKKIKRLHDDYDGNSSRSVGIDGGGGARGSVVVDERIFKCPFCDKVFESGQALGGHKKVHFSYLGNRRMLPKSKSSEKMLDLNLPAPEDDNDDGEGELSQEY